MPITERQALALLRSGTSVTELVRQHGHDLEVHMDFGKGVIAAARLDVVEDPETGETNVRATADVVDRGRKVKATLESSMSDAEEWIAEAIENNSGKLALAAVADFVSARGGSRNMVFARRFGAPSNAGVGARTRTLAVVMSSIDPDFTEPATPVRDDGFAVSTPPVHDDGFAVSTEDDEFRRDPVNTDDTPYHARKWR